MRRLIVVFVALAVLLVPSVVLAAWSDWPTEDPVYTEWDIQDASLHPPASGWCLPQENEKVKFFVKNEFDEAVDVFEFRGRVNFVGGGNKWKAMHSTINVNANSGWVNIMSITLPYGESAEKIDFWQFWVLEWDDPSFDPHAEPASISFTFRRSCV